MDIVGMPKVELHLHLDCSLSYEVVNKIDPSVTREYYQENFQAGPKCTNLVDYLKCAVSGIALMQTKDQLTWVTLDLFEQLQRDHVIYAEIRYAPLQHLEQGLTAEEVVVTVDQAVQEGIEATGIEVRIILCTLRHFTEEQSMQTVKLVEAFKGSRVVGLDIAADEAGYPIDAHVGAFAYARDQGIACTAHAGEARGADSVWETLEHLRPCRIGHGIRSIEDPALMEHLKQHQIHLEICPTSNIQTHIYDQLSDHTVDQIFRTGVSMSINTDGRTISDISLQREYANLVEHFGWSTAEFLKCNLNAIGAAFIPQELKRSLAQRMIEGVAGLRVE